MAKTVIAKFKTKAEVIQAYRIKSEDVGPIGSWVVLDVTSGTQTILSNKDFLDRYIPAGRGEAKKLHNDALEELGTSPSAAEV